MVNSTAKFMIPILLDVSLQLATGTGIAPFRSFLWKMFFEKHEDYKVKLFPPCSFFFTQNLTVVNVNKEHALFNFNTNKTMIQIL